MTSSVVEDHEQRERRCERASAIVVDDEVGICNFISMALNGLGFAAESFTCPKSAMASLDHGHPDLVFLDIALNGSDAIDVIRTLGAKRFQGVIQLMSGSDVLLLEDVRRIGHRHGLNMRPPLQKPIRLEAIRRALAAAPSGTPREIAPAAAPSLRVQLREAISNGWLELWYQPKIDLRSKALAGAEGLIRCRHPVHGILAPDSFLPEASEPDLAALTEYVVIAALRDWDELSDIPLAHHSMACSRRSFLSGFVFAHPTFLAVRTEREQMYQTANQL